MKLLSLVVALFVFSSGAFADAAYSKLEGIWAGKSGMGTDVAVHFYEPGMVGLGFYPKGPDKPENFHVVAMGFNGKTGGYISDCYDFVAPKDSCERGKFALDGDTLVWDAGKHTEIRLKRTTINFKRDPNVTITAKKLRAIYTKRLLDSVNN